MMQDNWLSKPMLDGIVAYYLFEVERYMEYAKEVERKLQRHMQDASGSCTILGSKGSRCTKCSIQKARDGSTKNVGNLSS